MFRHEELKDQFLDVLKRLITWQIFGSGGRSPSTPSIPLLVVNDPDGCGVNVKVSIRLNFTLNIDEPKLLPIISRCKPWSHNSQLNA